MGKANADWAKKVVVVHNESLDKLKLQRLTKDQRRELFKTIRYSFMSHEDLLGLTVNAVFAEAKDFIVEGLSVKLNSFENAIKSDL